MAFQATKHAGALGKEFSLLHLSNSRIRILALKKAEASDEVILRMVELDGKPAPDVRISFAGQVTSAREVNAQEQAVGAAKVSDGALVTSFTPYQPRTFAVRFSPSTAKTDAIHSQPVSLHHDLAVASNDDTKTSGGGFDGKGNAMPAEMLPARIDYHDVQFDLAAAKTGVPNAVVARGQTIELPTGHHNRVYILAAATGGDQSGTFRLGSRSVSLKIQDWGGFVGQWDTRIWKPQQPERDWNISANHAVWPAPDVQERERRAPSPRYPEDYVGLTAGYVKPSEIAWYASHRHTVDGLNEPYQYAYLFAYSIDLNGDERAITLPDNEKIRILAISVVEENPQVSPVQPLYDTLNRTEPEPIREKAIP